MDELTLLILAVAGAASIAVLVIGAVKSEREGITERRRRRMLIVGASLLLLGIVLCFVVPVFIPPMPACLARDAEARVEMMEKALATGERWLDAKVHPGITMREKLERALWARRRVASAAVFGLVIDGFRYRVAGIALIVLGALSLAAAFVFWKWILCAVGILFAAFVVNSAFPRLITSRISSCESAAVAGLRTYLGAQNTFHRSDYYDRDELVYANPHAKQGVGNGYQDLYQVGYPASPRGEVLKIIDVGFANASLNLPEPKPKAGYYFVDITGGTEGDYDFQIDCGLCAIPADYDRTGRNTFIIDVTGTVYQKDMGCLPVTRYPDVKLEGLEQGDWLPVGW